MFTLSIFLYIYLAFLLVWALFSITGLYHLFKFGFKNGLTILSALVYITMSLVILGFSFFYILQTDWSVEVMEYEEPGSNTNYWVSE